MSSAVPPPSQPVPSRRWPLREAERNFGELVDRVRTEGPQHVSVHGHDDVVVISTAEFRRLTATQDGRALIATLQNSPHRDVDLAPERAAMPVRDVAL